MLSKNINEVFYKKTFFYNVIKILLKQSIFDFSGIISASVIALSARYSIYILFEKCKLWVIGDYRIFGCIYSKSRIIRALEFDFFFFNLSIFPQKLNENVKMKKTIIKKNKNYKSLELVEIQ